MDSIESLFESVLKEFAAEVSKRKQLAIEKLTKSGYDPETIDLKSEISVVGDEIMCVITVYDNLTGKQIPIILNELIKNEENDNGPS